jgi:Flp pilus assembly pilin Flp
VKQFLLRMWREDQGVLSFEWILLVTLLCIGIIGGLAAARDAIIDEMGDVAQGMLALDQSFTLHFPLEILIDIDGDDVADSTGAASDSGFIDAALFLDCERDGVLGQGSQFD